MMCPFYDVLPSYALQKHYEINKSTKTLFIKIVFRQNYDLNVVIGPLCGPMTTLRGSDFGIRFI